MNPFFASLLSSAGSGLSGGILGKLFAGKKEKQLTGFQEGLKQKDYFRGLYGDKLNPWEWSGSGGFGVGGTAAPTVAAIGQRNLERQKVPKEMALAAAQMQTQRDVATIQAEGSVKAAQAARGVTDHDPGKMYGDKKFQSEVKNLNTKTEHVKVQIQRDKNISDALRTAKSLSDEVQQVINTLKGSNNTVVEQLQKLDIPGMLEEAKKNAKGNILLIKQAVSVMVNKINEVVDFIKPIANREFDIQLESSSSPKIK